MADQERTTGVGVPAPANVAATFCATLVDEWVRGGVTAAVLAPGSRSTPLALAVAADSRLDLHVHHDERSAGFLAVGIALRSGGPAVLVTTSGTATAELHPAVVEAHQAGLPMVVCTADRPPELQDVAAPQTIDQTHLFGPAVRWFHQAGVADWEARHNWRPVGARSVMEARGVARGGPPGPVHLNLAFREPLIGVAQALPAGRSGGRSWHEAVDAVTGPRQQAGSRLTEALAAAGGRGVIVAGGRSEPAAVLSLAEALAWPVLADARCGLATTTSGQAPEPVVVHSFDPLLRSAFGGSHHPTAVLWIGDRPASKVLGEWVASSDAIELSIAGEGRWVDPAGSVQFSVNGDPSHMFSLLRPATGGHETTWLSEWASAAATAGSAIDQVLDRHLEPTEPGVARAVTRAVAGFRRTGGPVADLVVSSSMPLRDVEWFGAFDDPFDVFANRGANGIDGVVSTAVGVAAVNRGRGDGRRTALLIGDIALLHDSNGLLGLAGRGLDLTIVVVDNDGGGIFSFLPQRAALATDRFEQLFATPHGVNLAALGELHHLPVLEPSQGADVEPAVAQALRGGGAHMVLVKTDRDANVVVHDELNAAVAARVAAL